MSEDKEHDWVKTEVGTVGGGFRESTIYMYAPPKPTLWQRIQKHNKAICVGGILLIFAYFAIIIYSYITPKEVKVTVFDTHWSYDVSLQQRRVEHGGDWRDQLPPHAFNLACEQRERTQERCNPYSCNPHNVSYRCNPTTRLTPYLSSRMDCSGRRGCRSRPTVALRTTTSYSTCYRTVNDTCYHMCPRYSEWCNHDKPVWVEESRANSQGNTAFLVRPEIAVAPRCMGDNELIPNHPTSCTTETIGYRVVFNAEDGQSWTYIPDNLASYVRFANHRNWTILIYKPNNSIMSVNER